MTTFPVTVDTQGAAEIMKIHPKTVEDLIASGAIPAAKVGRAWVLMTAHVISHVEQQIAAQTAARMGSGRRQRVTKAPQQGRSRAGSRNASSSGDSYAQ